MARYIDADRLMTKIHELYVQPNIELWQVVNCVANSPTADVVPKSEVEELIKKQIDLHEECSGLKKAKQEVAREIFEEIEKTVFADMDFFKELKKKYKEEKKDEN